MLPNFLFIGPDKTGSTWLYEILRAHPQVHVPGIKDLYFFDRHYDRGLSWYAGFFKDAGDAIARGELSHDYLFSVTAAERIKHDLPGVKLITCLRDPVDRCFSQYLYMIKSGRTTLDFAAALEEYPDLIDNSMYGKHLEEYFSRFSRDQIKVLFFEDLRRDPRAFAADVFSFLGVSWIEDLPYTEQVLPASRPRSYALARLVKVGANVARELGLETLVGRLKHSWLQRALFRAYAADEKPTIDPVLANSLRMRFQRDVTKLENLLGTRDLGRWKNIREVA